MVIKCIITDDEPLARKGLREYIEKTDFLSLAEECESAIELNSVLKHENADVVFLDVEMPGLTGIEFLATVVNPPKIIIVSAYEQYALKGYELDVFDYLLKPVSYERFLKSVNKLYDQLKKEQKTDEAEYIFIKADKKTKKILLKDILFAESMENYVVLHTHTTKEIVYCTLKMIAEKLPLENFNQIHRSFIVNTDHIQSLEGNILQVGPHSIPMSRDLKDEIYAKIVGSNFIARTKKDR